jgi:hypothetical protein
MANIILLVALITNKVGIYFIHGVVGQMHAHIGHVFLGGHFVGDSGEAGEALFVDKNAEGITPCD